MSQLSRRRFAGLIASIPAVLAVPQWARARAAEARTLTFEHLHTGERLKGIEYFSAGAYQPDALAEINRLLRDFRSGEVAPIDPQLLDLLHALHRLTDSNQAFQVISGFRSASTNAALRQRSSGVASRSLHLTGQAIDIRVGDVSLQHLRDAALSLRQGGVGYYRSSDFLHLDTGRVRSW